MDLVAGWLAVQCLASRWISERETHTHTHPLQTLVLFSGAGVILDRSVFSDKVFADQCHIDGFISDDGYAYYMALRTQVG